MFSLFITVSKKADVENLFRSSELQEVIVKEGNVQRTEYYDKNGHLSYAADKHYAALIKTSNDHSVLQEYFDEHGNPAQQVTGYYAILREYDDIGRNYRLTYLDNEGNPVLIRSGYAIIERTFNQDNQVEWEMYFDTEGNPVKTKSIGYGSHKEYNENGRNTLIVYVDENKKPIITRLGYAILYRTFYEEGPWTGKVENELYFDEQDQPIALPLGQYGVHKEYDEYGRNNILTYLDIKGQPMITKEGYTTIMRTFYPDDTVRTEMYFDLNGEPVVFSQGQSGILRENGNTTFLDADGKEQFNFRNFLYANPISVPFIAFIVIVGSMLAGKKENAILLLVYLGFIFYMTLMYRNKADTRTELELFWSYKQFFSSQLFRLEILNNIWLFIPLGTILYKLLPKVYVPLVSILFSLILESIQYFTGLGLCELDDVISNSLGALIGFGFGYALEPVINRFKVNNRYRIHPMGTIINDQNRNHWNRNNIS